MIHGVKLMEESAHEHALKATPEARPLAAGVYRSGIRSQATVPTEDPREALEFCKKLARLLDEQHGGSLGSVVRGPQPLENFDPYDAGSPDLTVVIPVYNEEENLLPLFGRLTEVLTGTGLRYELLFVDDGSSDGSVKLMHSFAGQDRRVVVVELARNFGHQIAVSAGLDFSRGRGVIVMDADLQDPPEVLPQFIARWQDGYDVVYAVRERRKESWLKRAAYSSFYRILRKAANVEIPLDAGDFCIMDQKVVDLLRNMPERTRFVRGMRSWVGLRQTGLPYVRGARCAGQPKYTFGRLMILALDGLISFSHLPLRVASLLGIAISLASFVLAAFYFVKKVTLGLSPPGFATLVVAILFFAGIQLLTIGVMGEYIGRIFDEVKRRPLYVVSSVTRGQL